MRRILNLMIIVGLFGSVSGVVPQTAHAQQRQLPLPIEIRPLPNPAPRLAGAADMAGPSAAGAREGSPSTLNLSPAIDSPARAGQALRVSYDQPLSPPNTSGDTSYPQAPSALRIGSYGRNDASPSDSARSRPAARLTKVLGSLAVVIGLLFGFIWVSRKFGSTRSTALPHEVVQTLGQFMIGPRQQVCVVRFGSKLLALSVSPTGIESLGELSDADEVEALTQLCLSNDPTVLPERLRTAIDRYAATRTTTQIS